MGVRQDLVLYRTAINRGYPITAEIRASLIEKVNGIIESESANNREKIGAAKVLLAADEFNRKSDDIESILALAELLGIREEVEESSEGRTSGNIEFSSEDE